MRIGRMQAGLRKVTVLVGSHSQFNDWCFQLDGVVRQVPCGQQRQASAGSGMLVKRQVKGALQPRSLTGERSELPCTALTASSLCINLARSALLQSCLCCLPELRKESPSGWHAACRNVQGRCAT